ncbi:MAG: LysR family transcriptional regulator, partial [Roseicyclus sp.]
MNDRFREAVPWKKQDYMDWNDIRVSLAIARAGSLNQAALLLGMDQSTVSRRLTALEAKLGTTLFQRSSHGVLPTEAGSVFVAKAIE